MLKYGGKSELLPSRIFSEIPEIVPSIFDTIVLMSFRNYTKKYWKEMKKKKPAEIAEETSGGLSFEKKKILVIFLTFCRRILEKVLEEL